MEDTIVNNNDLIPAPEKGLKKIVNKIFSLPLVPKMIIVIATFIVLSVGLYVAMAKDPQVAFLGIFGGGPTSTPVPATPPIPVTPPVYPSPSTYSRPCSPNANVTDLRLSGSCGTNGFRYINVRCTNNEDQQVNIVEGTCYSVQEALSKGIEYCKSTVCVMPSPSSSAQPLPSGCEYRSRICTPEIINCPTFVYCPPSPTPNVTMSATSMPLPVATPTPSKFDLCKIGCAVQYPRSNTRRQACIEQRCK